MFENIHLNDNLMVKLGNTHYYTLEKLERWEVTLFGPSVQNLDL